MDPLERAAESNGIWLCRTHGKLIDSDESRFTVDKLHEYKEKHLQAIQRKQARALQNLLNEYSNTTYEWKNPTKASLNLETVIQAFEDTGVAAIWNDQTEVHLAAALLTELAWNASTHANAEKVTFFTTDEEVGIRYIEGQTSFGLENLDSISTNGSGGWQQLKSWQRIYNINHFLNSYQTGAIRTWSIATLKKSLSTSLPCVAWANGDLLRDNESFDGEIQSMIDECSVVLVFLDRPATMSVDIKEAIELADRILKGGKQALISSPFEGNILQFQAWAEDRRPNWQLIKKDSRLFISIK
ncbi:MAG: hypothetical protein ACTH73_13180 [Glutamicibacter ardleyensis]